MNKDKILKIVKIVSCSLVALACIVELFVIIFDKEDDHTDEIPRDPFDAFTEFSNPSDVKKYTYFITYTESGITLNGKYTAIFSEENGERQVTLEYKYDKLNEIGESDEMISTLTGIIAASGESEISELFGNMDLPYGIFIRKEDFVSYEISDTRLTGKIADGSCGRGTRDIVLSFSKDAKSQKLTAFELSYVNEGGSHVRVTCKLEYKN